MEDAEELVRELALRRVNLEEVAFHLFARELRSHAVVGRALRNRERRADRSERHAGEARDGKAHSLVAGAQEPSAFLIDRVSPGDAALFAKMLERGPHL